MSRFLLAIFACFCILSVTTGAIAHAAEPIVCLDATEASLMGHSSGDADQVPSDTDKGFPHHHGGCHSHHVCDAVSDQTVLSVLGASNTHGRSASAVVTATAHNPALRPPIA